MSNARLLIIRFSSFGDIVQATSVPSAFRDAFPDAQVDWLVRRDFKALLEPHPLIDTVIAFERRDGLMGLVKLAWRLAKEGSHTHIYDAHNNLRSRIFLATYRVRCLFRRQKGSTVHVVTRSKNRLRRLAFFKLGIRTALPMPFRAVHSFLEPLRAWGVQPQLMPTPQFFPLPDARNSAKLRQQEISADIALVPSAAWALKRWPVESWKRLITLLPEFRFIVLGGPEDTFCAEIEAVAPDRVLNLAGQLSLSESSAALERVRLVISGDTGLLHVADQMGRPTLALIGPSAFGYPSQPTSETIETSLPCKPCSKDGRGRCRNSTYQKCMTEITPELVASRARARLEKRRESAQRSDAFEDQR